MPIHCVNDIRCRARRSARKWAILALSLVLPILSGGCPEFRNSTVDAMDTATRGILIGNTSPEEAGEAALHGILSAAFDLFFDQFRADETR